MSSYEEFDEPCERVSAFKSEEEAFEIIERVRPYLREILVDHEGSASNKDQGDDH